MINGYPYIPDEVVFWTAMAAAYVSGCLSVWLLRRWLLPIALVLGVLGYSMLPAAAHDHSRPELKPWFESLRSRAKASCCDGSDVTRLENVDWDSSSGRYRVRLNGQWIDVPEDAVVEGPNRAGTAMVWPFYQMGAPTGVRCFMPGSMS